MYEVIFSTSWDNLVKGVTTSIFLLLVSLISILGLSSDSLLLTIVLIIVFSSILLVPYLWMPRGYTVSDSIVTVKRPIGDVRISVAQVPLRWKWTWWGLRLFGSGGLYGYFGIFAFKGMGIVRMHATNRHKLVLIRDIEGRKYLLSPDEPERFIQQTQTPFPTQTTAFL